MTETGKPQDAVVREMNALRNRYETLKEEKTRCETNIENAKQQLEKLYEKARTEYGTDDLDALRAKLEAMKAENARRQETYKASLDTIEADLKAVDKAYEEES